MVGAFSMVRIIFGKIWDYEYGKLNRQKKRIVVKRSILYANLFYFDV